MSAHRCARCATPIEEDDLRCAVCGCATPPAEGAKREIASVLRCDGCGAAVAYSAAHQAPRCAFCASVMRVETPTDPIEKADSFMRFEVSPEQAAVQLRAWLRTLGRFRPSDLASSAAIQSLQPIFFACWIVDAKSLVSWTADSDAASGRSSWAPHAGQTLLDFERLLIPASRGLTHDECRRLTPYFDLGRASSTPTGPKDAVVEQFDVQRSAARAIVVDAILATAASRLTQGFIPGGSFRNVRVSALLHGLTTRRVGAPAYVLAYRYREKPYRAIVHGQDPRCVFGDAPFSILKIAIAVLVGLAVVGALIGIAIVASRR
jgi:hypothetical protein